MTVSHSYQSFIDSISQYCSNIPALICWGKKSRKKKNTILGKNRSARVSCWILTFSSIQNREPLMQTSVAHCLQVGFAVCQGLSMCQPLRFHTFYHLQVNDIRQPHT